MEPMSTMQKLVMKLRRRDALRREFDLLALEWEKVLGFSAE